MSKMSKIILNEDGTVKEIPALGIDALLYSEVKVEGNGTIKDMYAQRFLVTQDLYKSVTGQNPSFNKSSGKLPVESLTWVDAVKFCNKLSEIAGFEPAYVIPTDGDYKKITMNMNANGYRMPTVEEMKFLAKGGIKSKGYKYAGSNNPDEVAWTGNNSDNHTHEVGELLPNELGIYDTMGNVWKMCNDNLEEE